MKYCEILRKGKRVAPKIKKMKIGVHKKTKKQCTIPQTMKARIFPGLYKSIIYVIRIC